MPPKRASPAVVKSSPNKKKKAKSIAPPTPAPMPVLTDIMVPEQIELATLTFKILKKQKMVILVGQEDYPGCAKTMPAGEAIRLYTERLVCARRVQLLRTYV